MAQEQGFPFLLEKKVQPEPPLTGGTGSGSRLQTIEKNRLRITELYYVVCKIKYSEDLDLNPGKQNFEARTAKK